MGVSISRYITVTIYLLTTWYSFIFVDLSTFSATIFMLPFRILVLEQCMLRPSQVRGKKPYECRVPEGMHTQSPYFTKCSKTRSGERINVLVAQIIFKHVYHIKIRKQEGQEKKRNLALCHLLNNYLLPSHCHCAQNKDPVQQLLQLGRKNWRRRYKKSMIVHLQCSQQSKQYNVRIIIIDALLAGQLELVISLHYNDTVTVGGLPVCARSQYVQYNEPLCS